MSKRSEQRKASLAYRNKKLAVSRQTTKQSEQIKSGTEYSKRKFDLLKQINYVLSNPKDKVTGEPIFKEEYRLQARRHKAALINKETALNGDRQLQIGNDIRSWNEKAVKAAFGRQKTKGKSKAPTGWI